MNSTVNLASGCNSDVYVCFTKFKSVDVFKYSAYSVLRSWCFQWYVLSLSISGSQMMLMELEHLLTELV